MEKSGLVNKSRNPDGPQAFETPKEMTEADILQTINDFASAAENAMAAGFEATYEALIKELAYLLFMENPIQNGLLEKVRTWWPKTLFFNTFVGE